MKFKLQIDMNNAAFDDPAELPRILTRLAQSIREYECEVWNLRDINGNRVGFAKITGRRA